MVRAAVVRLALAGALFTHPATAQEWMKGTVWSGGWLSKVCGSQHSEDTLVCMGFLRGVMQGQEMVVVLKGAKAAFCKPQAADLKQLAAVIAKYGADHPEHHHYEAGPFTWLALSQAFPCE